MKEKVVIYYWTLGAINLSKDPLEIPRLKELSKEKIELKLKLKEKIKEDLPLRTNMKK